MGEASGCTWEAWELPWGTPDPDNLPRGREKVHPRGLLQATNNLLATTSKATSYEVTGLTEATRLQGYKATKATRLTC